MRYFKIFTLLVSLILPACSSNMPINNDISKEHPAAYMKLAGNLLKAEKYRAAIKWYYVGQIRFKAHLLANPTLEKSGDPALYASLKYVVGSPINKYAGGNPDEWASSIQEAIQWHNSNPNSFTSKNKYSEIYNKLIASYKELHVWILNNKDKIRKKRKQNGYKNR